MSENVQQALKQFTSRYIEAWQQTNGHEPESQELTGIASPCIVKTLEHAVRWLPQPFIPAATLDNVERALDIQLRPELHLFFTHQFAGDMAAYLADYRVRLLQAWSYDDFIRLQENLIGHLVTQRRLKLSPTLFIGTTTSDTELLSVCNLSGHVILEQCGTRHKQIIADDLLSFLQQISPNIYG